MNIFGRQVDTKG